MTELKEYISQARSQGFSDEDIKKTLSQSGWTDDQINEAFGVQQIPKPPASSDENGHGTSGNNEADQKLSAHTSKPSHAFGTPAAKPKKSLAIIALIFAILIPPIGSIIAIIALIQIIRKKQSGLVIAIFAFLLAPIMVIVYLFAFGAIIMAAVGGLSQAQLEDIAAAQNLCGSEVQLDVFNVGDDERVCATNTAFAAIIENKGLKDIEGFRLTSFGESGFQAVDIETRVPVGEMIKISASHESVGELMMVTLAPKILTEGNTISCTDTSLDFTELASCDEVEWDE